ncbi:MAG: hypothetical protein WB627_01225 [Candidatus Acidiferrum sp.]
MRLAAANAQFLFMFHTPSLSLEPFGFATLVEQLKLFGRGACLRENDRLRLAWRSSGARMNLRRAFATSAVLLCSIALTECFFAPEAHAQKLKLPSGASDAIEKIYSFDMDAAIADAQRMQKEEPSHPLGYLLEAEALWWRIWCTSAEFKYGMSDAHRRPKLRADQHYFDLITSASSIAQAHLREHETAEMQFYAGLADAFAARLYGLRGENRATARAGIRARAHFLRAIQMDPQLVDADFGLGLYNYYVDTLSTIAKFLGFFMGIPSGNKQEGIRQLEHDIADGVLTPDVARFYLAMDLHRYDQKYEKALAVIGPLVERYPSNPLFQLAQCDLYGKLGRKEQALACYRAVAALSVHDPECRGHIHELVVASLAAQGVANISATR